MDKKSGFFLKKNSLDSFSINGSFLEAYDDMGSRESSYITAHMQAIRTQPCFKDSV